MAKKTAQSIRVLVATGIAAVAGTLYLFNQNLTLSRQLEDGQRQCQRRTAALAESYQRQLEQLRDEFAGREIASVVTVSTASSSGEEEVAAAGVSEKPLLERFDETLEEIVARKYRFLFRALKLSAAEREELRRLLIERERLALRIRDAKAYGDETGGEENIAELEFELAENVDSRIQALLDPASGKRFQLLKDSDSEQQQFTQYTLGVNGLFPLSTEQQEAVLLTRLRHKAAFEEALASSGIDFDYPLTETQRRELLATVERAAMVYKHRFLEDIRKHLDHDNHPMDQYTLLENYTNTEFQELADSLRKRIDNRGLL